MIYDHVTCILMSLRLFVSLKRHVHVHDIQATMVDIASLVGGFNGPFEDPDFPPTNIRYTSTQMNQCRPSAGAKSCGSGLKS